MATITVRQLDVNGNPIRGGGQGNFLADLDAVAQIIGTRLKLLQGEWWLDLTDGTPVFQSIFTSGASAKAQQAAALIIQQRILDTQYVNGISNVAFSFNRPTRSFTYTCAVQTVFGTLNLAVTPGSAATLNP